MRLGQLSDVTLLAVVVHYSVYLRLFVPNVGIEYKPTTPNYACFALLRTGLNSLSRVPQPGQYHTRQAPVGEYLAERVRTLNFEPHL